MIGLSPFRYHSSDWDMLISKCSECPSSVKTPPGNSESMCTMMKITLKDIAWEIDQTKEARNISSGTLSCN